MGGEKGILSRQKKRKMSGVRFEILRQDWALEEGGKKEMQRRPVGSGNLGMESGHRVS